MNYRETIDYLYSQLPMFQRIGAAAYKSDLSNTMRICKLLGNPENDFPAIHIAGTNGKGSTAHMIASIMHEAGLKTALFTSPHLVDFRERIRLNGQMISKEYVVDFVEKYGDKASGFGASFFELTFGMAMKYFSDQHVDIAIVEVGMGGRLDSSNVVKPLVTVITNISKDHTAFLGHTLQEIAGEKAGIMKKGVPMIIGRNQPEIESVYELMASQVGTKIYHANDFAKIGLSDVGEIISFGISGFPDAQIDFPLKGIYQRENIVTALAALFFLSKNDGFSAVANPDIISLGLKNIFINTHFAGRWQICSKYPLTICDTGHNVDGLRQTMEQLQSQSFKTLRMVVGMVNDKNIDAALRLMPKDAVYYFCKADIPRGMPAQEIAHKAESFGLRGKVYSSVIEAFEAAKRESASEDLIFVGGSTFVVAEVV